MGSSPDPPTSIHGRTWRSGSPSLFDLWFRVQGVRPGQQRPGGPSLQPSQPPSLLQHPQKGGRGEGGGERSPRSGPQTLPTLPAASSAFSGLVGGNGLRACWEKFCQDNKSPSEGQGPHMLTGGGRRWERSWRLGEEREEKGKRLRERWGKERREGEEEQEGEDKEKGEGRRGEGARGDRALLRLVEKACQWQMLDFPSAPIPGRTDNVHTQRLSYKCQATFIHSSKTPPHLVAQGHRVRNRRCDLQLPFTDAQAEDRDGAEVMSVFL